MERNSTEKRLRQSERPNYRTNNVTNPQKNAIRIKLSQSNQMSKTTCEASKAEQNYGAIPQNVQVKRQSGPSRKQIEKRMKRKMQI